MRRRLLNLGRNENTRKHFIRAPAGAKLFGVWAMARPAARATGSPAWVPDRHQTTLAYNPSTPVGQLASWPVGVAPLGPWGSPVKGDNVRQSTNKGALLLRFPARLTEPACVAFCGDPAWPGLCVRAQLAPSDPTASVPSKPRHIMRLQTTTSCDRGALQARERKPNACHGSELAKLATRQ